LRVLEAGAGSATHFAFGCNAIIDGIDVSASAMSKNTKLNGRIIGDIQSYQVDSLYDIVICWTVLEHLKQPEKAMANILSWVVDGGLIIIDVPNVLSLKGLVTKATPMWLHRWAYRNIFHFITSRPFRTYLRLSLSPRRIAGFFERHEILYIGFGTMTLKGSLNSLYAAVLLFLRTVTLGYYHPGQVEFCIVVRKRG
jgi:2-polyprenyl-3-methyl-5-hydroxy-6-metoxy-1,4-benzoquinol methylase